MRIHSVAWRNYRGIPDGEIEVRNHLVLVGPNDSGKSSVVRALNMCLGMGHTQLLSAVSLRDFSDPAAPLELTVTLDGIDEDDRSAFPDEINTGPPELLTISIDAVIDPEDLDQKTVRRYFPYGGHGRAPSREQIEGIGFEFVPAVRSLYRELGGARTGAIRSLLSGLDLSADATSLSAAADGFRAALDGSTALAGFRKELAAALTGALPDPVDDSDVRVVSEYDLLDDPLSGVTVTVKDGDHDVPLAEQSDGIRALSVLTLLGMSHRTASIVAVDEPETHLHPAAQRSLVRSLTRGVGQRVLVTHSPAVVAAMSAMDIVAFRADKRTHQLPPGSPIATDEATVRHWSTRLIEPLTARRVVVVEGVSDRILVERVAELIGLSLDRLGVAVFELGGADLFPTAYNVFGSPGFDVPLVGMLDLDARAHWAKTLGVDADEMADSGYVVCDPDLEAEYIGALGSSAVMDLLIASPGLSEASLLRSCGVGARSDVSDEMLHSYCGHKKRKVASALAVSNGMTPGQAASIKPIVELLGLVR